MGDLPGAESEAKAAHTLFGGTLLVNEEATRASVVPRLATHDLIYVAAHGFSDPHNPIDKSFIVLSDGRLTAREVQNLHMGRRPLVILSACQTGEGGIVDGGIIGLARGFQLANAANTVMSLWAVDDQATAALMGDFGRNLAKNAPAEALRIAMLNTRKKYSNPAKWAAFNVFGNHSIARIGD